MTKVACKAWRLCEVSTEVVIVTEGYVCLAEAITDGGQVYLQTSLVELVVKSCVGLLRSCGINIPVVFRHPCVLIRQQTTYHF